MLIMKEHHSSSNLFNRRNWLKRNIQMAYYKSQS